MHKASGMAHTCCLDTVSAAHHQRDVHYALVCCLVVMCRQVSAAQPVCKLVSASSGLFNRPVTDKQALVFDLSLKQGDVEVDTMPHQYLLFTEAVSLC